MSSEALPPSQFAWQAHPARERLGRAVVGVAVVILLAGIAGVLMESSGFGILALLILVLALNRFFFPSHFSIDAEGITASYPLRRLRKRWADLRRFVVDANGGYLSARARGSRFDAFGGMHVLFGEQRQTVIEQIRGRLTDGGPS
jgi:hypothetical protein